MSYVVEKEKNVIQKKSYNFALQVIQLNRELNKQSEYVLSKQVLRSGTSIGANIEEAIGSYSKKEFLSKIFIAYKEARETHYWLRLLIDSKYVSVETGSKLLADAEEILRILGAIIKTTRNSIS